MTDIIFRTYRAFFLQIKARDYESWNAIGNVNTLVVCARVFENIEE